MQTLPLHGFNQKPDQGKLKRGTAEYESMQNVRGIGHHGTKRPGVATLDSTDSAIMGIFDLKVDSDPTSPDKIVVMTRGGDWLMYEAAELLTVFNYLMASGIYLNLQSPDLNWWSVTANASGLIPLTVIAAPASSQASDFNVAVGQLFGFADSAGIWRIYSEAAFTRSRRYATVPATTTYSSALSISDGYGIVFEEPNLNRVRYTINNSGFIISTVIA